MRVSEHILFLCHLISKEYWGIVALSLIGLMQQFLVVSKGIFRFYIFVLKKVPLMSEAVFPHKHSEDCCL